MKTIRCLIFVAVTNLFDNLLKKDVKFGFFPCFLSVFWCFVPGANPWKRFCLTWHRKETRLLKLAVFFFLDFFSFCFFLIALDVFYLGTKVFKILALCTPLSSDPHFWGSCFSFWVPMFLDKFSLRKKKHFNFRFFCHFEVWNLHWNSFQEQSIFCRVLMDIHTQLSLTVRLRSQNTGSPTRRSKLVSYWPNFTRAWV